MNKFEQKEMKNKRPIKNTLYDCLINYSKTHKKSVNGFKNNSPGDYFKRTAERGKKLGKPKIEKGSEDDIIEEITNLFGIRKKNKAIRDKKNKLGVL